MARELRVEFENAVYHVPLGGGRRAVRQKVPGPPSLAVIRNSILTSVVN